MNNKVEPIKTENSDNAKPEIYKQEEFNIMLEMIMSGLWGTKNLSNALHVDEDTITKWKRMPEAIKKHRESLLKFLKRRTDVEKILKELDVETDPDITALVQNNYYQLNDEQLDTLIQSKLKQVGVGKTSLGERKTDEGKSA